MRTVSQSQETSRRMRLELDETEQFEVEVNGRRAKVVEVTLRWTRSDHRQHATWSLQAINIRKDGSLGAARWLQTWDVEQPEIVTRVLSDLAPEWFE